MSRPKGDGYNPGEHERKEFKRFSIGMTQQEIAERFGITKARVGQIERKALRKIREALEEDGLSFELLTTTEA